MLSAIWRAQARAWTSLARVSGAASLPGPKCWDLRALTVSKWLAPEQCASVPQSGELSCRPDNPLQVLGPGIRLSPELVLPTFDKRRPMKNAHLAIAALA